MNSEERLQKSESGILEDLIQEKLRLEEVGPEMERSAKEVKRGPEKTDDTRRKHNAGDMPKQSDASVRKLCKTINEVLHSVNHSPQQNVGPDVALDPDMQAHLKNMVGAMYSKQGRAKQLKQPPNPFAKMVSNLSKELSNSLTDEPVHSYDEEPTVASNQQTLKKEGSGATVGNHRDSLEKAMSSLIKNFGSDSEDYTSEDDLTEEEWRKDLVKNADINL